LTSAVDRLSSTADELGFDALAVMDHYFQMAFAIHQVLDDQCAIGFAEQLAACCVGPYAGKPLRGTLRSRVRRDWCAASAGVLRGQITDREEGSEHPDRNAQFEHLNRAVQQQLWAGEPTISVDTKKLARQAAGEP